MDTYPDPFSFPDDPFESLKSDLLPENEDREQDEEPKRDDKFFEDEVKRLGRIHPRKK